MNRRRSSSLNGRQRHPSSSAGTVGNSSKRRQLSEILLPCRARRRTTQRSTHEPTRSSVPPGRVHPSRTRRVRRRQDRQGLRGGRLLELRSLLLRLLDRRDGRRQTDLLEFSSEVSDFCFVAGVDGKRRGWVSEPSFGVTGETFGSSRVLRQTDETTSKTDVLLSDLDVLSFKVVQVLADESGLLYLESDWRGGFRRADGQRAEQTSAEARTERSTWSAFSVFCS